MTDLPGGRQALNYAVRKPLGVVAVIVPWNLPLLLLTWKVAPALACGNAVVVKPSEETPSTATLLAEVLDEAGLARRRLQRRARVRSRLGRPVPRRAPGHRRRDVHRLVRDRRRRSCARSRPRVRPVSFELGGKNAALVFADADLDATLAGLTRSVFANTGQVCLCTERVYIQRAVFDDVASGLVERARALRLGRPEDAATTTGPLISHEHREKVLGYYRLAEECGREDAGRRRG